MLTPVDTRCASIGRSAPLEVARPADTRQPHPSGRTCAPESRTLRGEAILSPFAQMSARAARLRRDGADPPVPVAAYNRAHSNMPLGPGSRLDAYEMVRPLGSGGMGEVWLATEVRLGRKVALKVLPPDLRVQRFEQEARAASALNHPNVCTIHALGQTSDGQHYIAMEHVDGQTLRHRLSTSRLTIRESVDIAIQVGAALSAAHETGIVHRDIKPENVMLRPDGLVKVLDFGLAKLAPAADRAEDRCGNRGRHRRLHVAGAGARAGGRCPHGHLVTRRNTLRDGGRTLTVCCPKWYRGARSHSRP